MPALEPTHIKIRVEFVTRPKKKVTAENIPRKFLPWSEVSHEMDVKLGNSNEAGTVILCVDKNGTPTREWFWDSDVLKFALDPETEVLPGSGWVKITYVIAQDGELHTDTACYPVDAFTQQPLEELVDPEFTLCQTGPDDIKLIFPLDPGAAPICAQLQTALAAVSPDSLGAASYRIALIANMC